MSKLHYFSNEFSKTA